MQHCPNLPISSTLRKTIFGDRNISDLLPGADENKMQILTTYFSSFTEMKVSLWNYGFEVLDRAQYRGQRRNIIKGCLTVSVKLYIFFTSIL